MVCRGTVAIKELLDLQKEADIISEIRKRRLR